MKAILREDTWGYRYSLLGHISPCVGISLGQGVELFPGYLRIFAQASVFVLRCRCCDNARQHEAPPCPPSIRPGLRPVEFARLYVRHVVVSGRPVVQGRRRHSCLVEQKTTQWWKHDPVHVSGGADGHASAQVRRFVPKTTRTAVAAAAAIEAGRRPIGPRPTVARSPRAAARRI